MSNTQRRFEWLAKQFESLRDGLEQTNDPDERNEFLRRMGVILAELDSLAFKEGFHLDPKERVRKFTFLAKLERSD